ncbi:MAG: hypothetical protein HC929_18260, partial [Leptolyngbyaceae cyanobacterium SM2_5_2]|nr:hypothetical protein [Leptolyngbyaceae cyanobacterium SM2_5_2]
ITDKLVLVFKDGETLPLEPDFTLGQQKTAEQIQTFLGLPGLPTKEPDPLTSQDLSQLLNRLKRNRIARELTLQRYQDILKKDSNEAEAYTILALALIAQGKQAEATSLLEGAFVACPEYGEALYTEQIAYLRKQLSEHRMPGCPPLPLN